MRKDVYIICSAVWINDGKQHVHQPNNVESGYVVAGRRHCNCFHTLTMMHSDYMEYKKHHPECGFLTSDNEWASRYKASRIAFKAGQIDKLTNGMSSEDLY